MVYSYLRLTRVFEHIIHEWLLNKRRSKRLFIKKAKKQNKTKKQPKKHCFNEKNL